jgi:hypothetical protein
MVNVSVTAILTLILTPILIQLGCLDISPRTATPQTSADTHHHQLLINSTLVQVNIGGKLPFHSTNEPPDQDLPEFFSCPLPHGNDSTGIPKVRESQGYAVLEIDIT